MKIVLGKWETIVIFLFCHFPQAEIKELLSIVLRDLHFSSAVVHQVRNFLSKFCMITSYLSCDTRLFPESSNYFGE